MVSFEDFKKLEIKTAKILEANDHPNADKLLVFKVEVGDEQKQIVAGIKGHYTNEELIGKTIVIIDNLEQAIIRGEESNGMLLATRQAETLSLLTPDKPVASGNKVS
jgi:methionyl-tRNA synthetase